MRYGLRSRLAMVLLAVLVFFILFGIFPSKKKSQKISPLWKTKVIPTSTQEKPNIIKNKEDGNLLTDPETTSTKIITKEPVQVEVKEKTIDPSKKSNEELISHYGTDEHLLSLLEEQANPKKQVIVTIIGGDSYSLFAWDWYERMKEISNSSLRCTCFVVAMDEIAVVVAVKRNIPVFYSTYSFEDQMQWINSIEARQHSLYRVGHAKFDTAAKIARLGYSVLLSEMDVFWRSNPLDYLKQPEESYDLQISDHFGSHPRVNIGVFFVRSTKESVIFFKYVAEFWVRFGKGGFLADQRVLDALLKNYDRIDKTYLRAVPPIPPLNWTTHAFGNHFSHMMTDGSAFFLFNQAAKVNLRSKKFYGNNQTKYFTVTVDSVNMPINDRNILMRALLILHQTVFKNRTFILPAFAANSTRLLLHSQLDIKKFLLYWSDENIRQPAFLDLDRSASIIRTKKSFSINENYDDVEGILELSLDSIPLNLKAPYPLFEVFVRDSLLWCSTPVDNGNGWCLHHPRDFGATMEILFSCRGDPYPPCANKTEQNEQFLKRPYETD